MATRVDISAVQGIYDLLSLLHLDSEIILMEMSKAIAKIIPAEQVNLARTERQPNLHPGVWMRKDFDRFRTSEFWEDKY